MAHACFIAARLALVMLPPLALAAEDRELRARKTREWLGTLRGADAIRAPLEGAVAAAGASAEPAAVAEALRELARLARAALEGEAHDELVALAETIRARGR